MIAVLHQIAFKFLSVIMSLLMLFGINSTAFKTDSNEWNTNYTSVFVHGLAGWGDYDSRQKLLPYWGLLTGDVADYLEFKGFGKSVSASVDPQGSAWDRACELYAQLTGSKVDYGAAHSAEHDHDRFGDDYSGKALIDSFSETNKINLFGHSFGGATIRLFTSIMEFGSEEELAAADDVSEFFKGGKGSWIYSLTTISAPHNGTTAYEVGSDNEQRLKIFNELNPDSANHDLQIDYALELNKTIKMVDSIYYFSVPTSATKKSGNKQVADLRYCELHNTASANAMGSFTGVTPGGYAIDESWQENDGSVNTISARAPFGDPQQEFDENNIKPGVWNIMPTHKGDHQSLIGNVIPSRDIKGYYAMHLDMINKL